MTDNKPPSRNRIWITVAAVTTTMALASLGTVGYLLLIAEPNDVSDDVQACLPTRDFREGAVADEDRVVCPPDDAGEVQGLITDDDGTFITVQPSSGRAEKILVREPDRKYIDIAHGETHASLGQPVVVYTDEFEGDTIAVYMADAPITKKESDTPH